ncbi:MAG: glycosyltransferase family 4 protein [Gaiellaceae bacterium]
MRVAYYSPMPPERSGIADYSALLVPALAKRVELDVAPRHGSASGDAALYHVGNDADVHGWILERLRRRPGIVVLHDFVLHHLVAGLTLGRKNPKAYLAALERDGGVAARLLGLGVIDGCLPPLWEVRPQDFPLCGEVLELASGVIVHSRYVEERLRERGYDRPVWRVPMAAWPSPPADVAAVDGSPLLGAFGHMNASKRVPQLLRAFARFRDVHPEARLVLAGSADPSLELPWRIEQAGLDDSVVREDYVPEERLWALLRRVDAAVALRAPTMGETSAVVIRALSVGTPLVVSDVGWFSELPDGVALKVAPDEREIERLVGAFETLSMPGVRETMGRSARALAQSEHDLERVADLYAAALEEAAGVPALSGARS